MEDFSITRTLGVFGASYIMGILLGIGLFIGFKPTGLGISKLFVEFACLTGDLSASGCDSMLLMVTVLSILVLAISIITHIRSVHNLIVGIISYAIGTAMGFLTIFAIYL